MDSRWEEKLMTRFASTPVRIAYDDAGTAEPGLLFLPGWCANRTVFKDLVAESGRHRRVLALDWRAHGGQRRSARTLERELPQDALPVIEARGVRRVVPVALPTRVGWPSNFGAGWARRYPSLC